MTVSFIYRLLLRLLFPAIVAGTVIAALRGGGRRYLMQRLSCGLGDTDTATRPLWIHCASVGETNAALAFTGAWLKRHPDDNFVLTTSTATAAAVLARRIAADSGTRICHYYLPFDYPLFCRRFLNTIEPRCALIMETEIWLNLFTACAEKNIPLLILNARLSRRTLDSARKFRTLREYYRHSLSLVQKVLARGETDTAAFTSLGVAPERIEAVGNLKRAGGMDTGESLPNLIGKRYVLAASTHDDEELRVAEAWRQTDANSDCLLVIAPRHPQRGRAIEKQLGKRGFRVQRRNHRPRRSYAAIFELDSLLVRNDGGGNKKPQESTEIYIADTLGELPALIRHAELVFTGGSFAPVGGHNVLEAAQLGVPQVVGPHTDSVREDVEALKAAGGLIEAADETVLKAAFRAALNRAPEHAIAAQNALALTQTFGNIADEYVTRIKNLTAVSLRSVIPARMGTQENKPR